MKQEQVLLIFLAYFVDFSYGYLRGIGCTTTLAANQMCPTWCIQLEEYAVAMRRRYDRDALIFEGVCKHLIAVVIAFMILYLAFSYLKFKWVSYDMRKVARLYLTQNKNEKLEELRKIAINNVNAASVESMEHDVMVGVEEDKINEVYAVLNMPQYADKFMAYLELRMNQDYEDHAEDKFKNVQFSRWPYEVTADDVWYISEKEKVNLERVNKFFLNTKLNERLSNQIMRSSQSRNIGTTVLSSSNVSSFVSEVDATRRSEKKQITKSE